MTDEKNLSTFEEGSEDFAAMFAAQEAGTVRLQPGQKVTGTIITITGDSVFVDVGIKLDGIMDRKDILDAEGNESVAPGDSIEVYVVGTSAGEIRLSRSMSGAGMAALEDARDAGVPVDGRVTGTCKGGYTVSVMGKNAFCPGSQMDSVSVADAEALVGRTMQFLIIRVETAAATSWFPAAPCWIANVRKTWKRSWLPSMWAIPWKAASPVWPPLVPSWNWPPVWKA